MTDYDSMGVHDLIAEIIELEYLASAHIESYGYMELDSIESALRRAVIREAQVGEISIEQHEGYMSPDPMFTVGSKSKLVAGEYWLVPKAATTDSLENSRHSGKRERRASERKRP